MSQAQLYTVDDSNKWKPVPLSDFGASTTSTGESTTTGGATALKQDEIIGLITQLLDLTESASQAGRTPAQTPLTPSLEIATTSGTIPAGAKFVSIGVRAGTGTILGAPVDSSIAVIEFPYVAAGYAEIPYTLDSGEFTILSGR